MAQKTVLIVEDEAVMRGNLQHSLRDEGIRTIAAASPDEARAAVKEEPGIDVVVLDIRFAGTSETGFDFGFQLKNDLYQWPPEFLIHSAFAYEQVDYFQAALKLEAVAYLKKGESGRGALPRLDVVAQHVRALALRRAMRGPKMAIVLQNIARTSASCDDAIERFCRDVLCHELETTLGPGYVLLLTRGQGTVAFSGESLEHLSRATLQQLQSAVHARLGSTEPFIVSRDAAPLLSVHQPAPLQRIAFPMEGAAFIELGEVKSARLTLGLLPGEHSARHVKEQVELLDRYLQKPVIAHLLEVTERWAELDLQRRFEVQKREVLLEATSNFCLHQAEEIQYALRNAQDKGEADNLAAQVHKLKAIATEMRDAGEILSYFAHSTQPEHSQPNVEMATLVEQVWLEEVSPVLRLSGPGILTVAGKCVASDWPERTERAVSQILGWMGRRLTRSPEKDGMSLSVKCLLADDGHRVQVIFEEHTSRRLPKRLRKSFFEPFYTQSSSDPGDMIDGGRRLGLYLANTLAGLAGGKLEDQSDIMTGALGHRFVLELPAAAPM